MILDTFKVGESIEYLDINIINQFNRNDGKLLFVELENKERIKVWNIAWGYDIGDEYAHVTTNISPEIKNETIDFFFTNEITKISDNNGKIIFEKKLSI